jgi:hypothetical protein
MSTQHVRTIGVGTAPSESPVIDHLSRFNRRGTALQALLWAVAGAVPGLVFAGTPVRALAWAVPASAAYDGVGATARELPAGHHHIRRDGLLGRVLFGSLEDPGV